MFATGLLHRLPPFNVCISNVPGPNVPVYLGGAKLLAQYPTSVITDGQGYSATRAEYQVTRWLSLLSSVSTIGRTSANVRVSKDY